MTTAPESQRIDKWLWCARFFRTRALATAFVERDSVRLTRRGQSRRISKPAFALQPGDELAFLLSDRPVVVRVCAFSPRRGSALDAAALFERLGGD